MPKSNSYKAYDVHLSKVVEENQVFLKHHKKTVLLKSTNPTSNLTRTPITHVNVVRSITEFDLTNLLSRIEQHLQFSLTSIALDYLKKSKELKLMNCLFEDVAYINYLRSIHWIDTIEHLHCSTKQEKSTHKQSISDIKTTTTKLLAENKELLDNGLWVVKNNYQQSMAALMTKLMQHKLKIYNEQLERDLSDDLKHAKKSNAEPTVIAECPLINDKAQIESLNKVSVEKLTLPNAHALYKFLQFQVFNYNNETTLKKWDKDKTIDTLLAKIEEKFINYNPENMCDALNQRFSQLKAKYDNQLEVATERLKNQALITKEKINEYEKNNLTHEEEIYWWNYAEIYKTANAKLNENLALQNLYVKNIYKTIQEYTSQAQNEIQFNDLPGLIHPLRFASEIKLNITNLDNKITLSNEKSLVDEQALQISIFNDKCDPQAVSDLNVLSKFKNAKNFQTRAALLHEVAHTKYTNAVQAASRRYAKQKADLLLSSQNQLKNLSKVQGDIATIKQILEFREKTLEQNKNEIQIENK